MTRTPLLPAALVAALASTLVPAGAAAQEIPIVGTHRLRGQAGGVPFEGALTIAADATYRLERRRADGTTEHEAGRAAVVGKGIVLQTGAGGITGGLAGGAARAYAREGGRKRIEWAWASGADHERIDMGEGETVPELVRRLLAEGRELRWVFKHNRGYVERDGARSIHRSKRPEPRHVDAFVRDGGRTILSLSGPQDHEAWRTVRVDGEDTRERVVLSAYIRAQGLRHEYVSMSASRAPSDAELVAAFRVLLDDAARPVLLHCRGGSDRTGVIGAIFQHEFLGVSKAQAKREMRAHMWVANDGTEIQGAYFDLYQKGHVRALLAAAGVPIPARYR